MKLTSLLLALIFSTAGHSFAEVTIDDEAFGKSLGGWKKRDKAVVDYPLSGADYRTYKPEKSPTPDGGIFISVRIDHLRGWLASDDHAILEISVSPKGAIVSAQSTIAIQGQSIKSDVILSGNDASKAILSPEVAVQVGTDLVANLTAKLLRENIVEAGRVSFPSVLRHNYNHLFKSIRVDGAPVLPATAAVPSAPLTVATIPAPAVPSAAPVPPVAPPPASPTLTPSVAPEIPPTAVPVSPPPAPAATPPAESPAPVQAEKPKEHARGSAALEIKPYG